MFSYLFYILWIWSCGASWAPMINNCRSRDINFKRNSSWSIGVNMHCESDHLAFKVFIEKNSVLNGVYESYGLSDGVPRFEYVLKNGSTYTLQRIGVSANKFWVISKGQEIYFGAQSRFSTPPLTGWGAISAGKSNQLSDIQVKRMNYEAKPALTSNLSLKKFKYSHNNDKLSSDERLLTEMLHPAISYEFGAYLNKYYIKADPYPLISLDNVFKNDLLLKSLDFLNVPLSEWVGPEEMPYCCKGKYRLDFNKWNLTKYSRALQSITGNTQFISFIEGLTGISGIIAMKMSDPAMLWAGSNIIAIAPKGYLLVHNDFNYMNGLYRRINVLLYLNEHWNESWQGHLEMWSVNSTQCVHRIPPIFNRMSIFTVTDDAFHGHPEPLASHYNFDNEVSVEGELIDGNVEADPVRRRYAFQIVYYTKEQGPSNSSNKSKKRKFSELHGAVFQPNCNQMSGLREYCERDAGDSISLKCQCNYRDV